MAEATAAHEEEAQPWQRGKSVTTTFGIDVGGAVLGAVVLEGEIPADIRPLLTPDLFSGDRRVQAKAILEANDTLGATDPVSVQEILSRQGQPLDMILDIVKLAELVFSSAHLAAHVQLLREQVADAAPPLLSQNAEDFLSGTIEPVEFAIENTWPYRASGMLGGDSGIGKTWLAIEMGLALSTGTPFLGKYHVKRKYRVMVWEEEEPRTREKRRNVQLLKGRGRARAQCEKSLTFLVGHGLKIDSREGLEILRREIESFRPEFIIVGNLREIHLKDENSHAMAHVRDAFRTFTRDFGCAFIVIHHYRKAQEGQSKRGSQMLAGSGIWAAWCEAWMWCTPGRTEDVMILEVGSKDASEGKQIIVQRRDVTEGEPIAADAGGGQVWPVVLAEITTPSEEQREDSPAKIIEAITRHVADTDTPAPLKDIIRLSGLSRRTVVTYLPDLVLEGRVQVQLHMQTKCYSIPF